MLSNSALKKKILDDKKYKFQKAVLVFKYYSILQKNLPIINIHKKKYQPFQATTNK